TLPDYAPRVGKANDWGYDAAEQRTRTYTGMGMDINVHDSWAVESPGPIADRTTEHLGTTDRAITANRRLLLRAIDGMKAGRAPPATEGGLRGPVAIDTVVPADGWETAWQAHDRTKRARSPWAGDLG
ncbi:MAG: aromatic ring-hydroxylating dioxygenase subunit alpha, partial [Rhodospirillales bacterium]